MTFEEDKSIEKLGEKFGFLFSYFLFTTILFLILVLLKNLPESWSYINLMGVTIAITLAGAIIKKFLR